jgi:DNA polymerase/3'-5' exonuclease PolX
MGKAQPLAAARVVAEALVYHMKPFAERIEIAGSIRRGISWVKDAEIVMVPKLSHVQKDLFGDPVSEVFHDPNEGLAAYNRIERYPMEIRSVEGKDGVTRRIDGQRFKGLVDTCSGLALDLFIVRPPATWGCIFFIRTGPADWNKRAMKLAHARGLQFEGGQLLMQSTRRPLPTEEEEAVFHHLKARFKQPSDRK